MRRITFQHGVRARAAALLLVWAMVSVSRAEPADVVVRTVDVEAFAGRLVSFSLTEGLRLEVADAAGVRRIDAADVVEIAVSRGACGAGRWDAMIRDSGRGGADRFAEDDPDVASPETFEVTLGGGSAADRLVGVPGVYAGERLGIEVASLGRVSVPLEQIAVWRNLRLAGRKWRSAIAALAKDTSDGSDRLLLTNGDRIRGVVTAIDWEGFRVEPAGGDEVRIEHNRVVAAAIVHVPPEGDDGLRARIELNDGSRVTASRLDWRDGAATVNILDGLQREIAAEAVTRIDIVGGRWQWLTELGPISHEQTPMMTVGWPTRIDRNVLGGWLTTGGRRFDRGVGVHSRSSLIYDLRGAYREFVSWYGMDDASGPLADVTVNIRVDGELRYEEALVGRGRLLGPVRVDVRRADRIELIVDFGRFGGVQDRFNWIEPALIR